MDASGFKKRLSEAKKSSEFIKIFFQYPNMAKGIKKSGTVISVDKDSFTIQEIKDGVATYSYNFIAEILREKNEM